MTGYELAKLIKRAGIFSNTIDNPVRNITLGGAGLGAGFGAFLGAVNRHNGGLLTPLSGAGLGAGLGGLQGMSAGISVSLLRRLIEHVTRKPQGSIDKGHI